MVADSRAPRRRRTRRGGDPARRPRLRPPRLLRLRPRHPPHRPSCRRRAALHELPRHAAVLADPRRAADRPQPPRGGHACPVELRQRLPAHARPHQRPRCDHRRGAARRRLRHLRGRQVAPVPHGAGIRRRTVRAVAHTTRLRPLLRLPRGRDRPVPPRAHLRQPPCRRLRRARGRLPPVRGPGGPSDRVPPRQRLDPPRPAVPDLPLLRGDPRAAPGSRGVPRPVARPLRRGLGRRARAVARPTARARA